MSQTVHNVVFQQLRTMGYKPDDAKAIIWIAKASPECKHAKKWWTSMVDLYSSANMEALLENVRKIGARYSLAFLPVSETPLSIWLREKFNVAGQPEISEMEFKLLLEKIALLNGRGASA